MPKDPLWEFKPAIGWGPFQLGQTREEVISLLNLLGFAYEADDEDPDDASYTGILVFEPYMHLSFDNIRFQQLEQICTDSKALGVNGMPLSGASLADALTALGVESFAATDWRDRHPEDDFDDEPVPHDAQRDEGKLLDEGTLWLAQFGIGLYVIGGIVDDIAIRAVSAIPRGGWGPLSDEQYERSAKLHE